jgi:hypothetical protein
VKQNAEYLETITLALSDNREAFEELTTWANDDSHVFSSRAKQVYHSIIESHSEGFYSIRPWSYLPKEISSASPPLKLHEIKSIYETVLPLTREAIIEYVGHQQYDIPDKEKMEFLADILRNESNLRVMTYAGRVFKHKAKLAGFELQIEPIMANELLEWWDENRDKFP